MRSAVIWTGALYVCFALLFGLFLFNIDNTHSLIVRLQESGERINTRIDRLEDRLKLLDGNSDNFYKNAPAWCLFHKNKCLETAENPFCCFAWLKMCIKEHARIDYTSMPLPQCDIRG